jgi:Ca-activated chloride channel family protein
LPSRRSTRRRYRRDADAGETGGEDLESRLESAAEDRIYSTFVGVGVDFNTELVETINAVRGGNYYAVHSP